MNINNTSMPNFSGILAVKDVKEKAILSDLDRFYTDNIDDTYSAETSGISKDRVTQDKKKKASNKTKATQHEKYYTQRTSDGRAFVFPNAFDDAFVKEAASFTKNNAPIQQGLNPLEGGGTLYYLKTPELTDKNTSFGNTEENVINDYKNHAKGWLMYGEAVRKPVN